MFYFFDIVYYAGVLVLVSGSRCKGNGAPSLRRSGCCTDQATSTVCSSVDICSDTSLELADKFCYFIDMLSIEGDADASAGVTHGINLGNWRLCLPIRTSHFISEEVIQTLLVKLYVT